MNKTVNVYIHPASLTDKRDPGVNVTDGNILIKRLNYVP